MTRRLSDYAPLACALVLVVLCGAEAARGQSTRRNVPSPAAAGQPATQLTPQQVRDIMYYRALQSRSGGRGVRTGVPQFVPLGGLGFGGFGPYPVQATQPQAAAPTTSSTRKTAEQKKAELREKREKREEEKRIAREEAKRKRLEAAKARAAAKAEKQAAAKP